MLSPITKTDRCEMPTPSLPASLPAASLSLHLRFPARWALLGTSNYLIYLILSSIGEAIFQVQSRFLPALREAARRPVATSVTAALASRPRPRQPSPHSSPSHSGQASYLLSKLRAALEGKARHESRSVRQHAVPGGLQPRRTRPGDGRAGACGARRRIRVPVVSASLADPSDADAADYARHGLHCGPRAGHDDRAEYPDPAAAQPRACGRGSRNARRADRRQLHPRRRLGIPPAGARRV